jgi:hypothetical protein
MDETHFLCMKSSHPIESPDAKLLSQRLPRFINSVETADWETSNNRRCVPVNLMIRLRSDCILAAVHLLAAVRALRRFHWRQNFALSSNEARKCVRIH